MPKLKIVHKGLILVAVPLIFGIGFISVLFFGLLNASRLVDREIMLKDALISHFSIMACGLCGLSGQQMYSLTQDPTWKVYYVSEQKRALSSYKHLRTILKKERELKIPPLKEIYNAIKTNPDHKFETPLSRKLQSISYDESKAAAKALDSLRLTLWLGVASGLLVSSVLAVFFCLNITNRLLIIMNNALSLSHGTALNPPFQGSDEIAELDQSLYKSATEIRELERFKKEMVGVVSHELKSPLSSVGGFLSSLKAGVYGELDAKAHDKVNRTYGSVERLMGLVGELLYLDRLELDMNPEEIQVDELLAASVDTVKELSEKSGIEIKVTSNGGKLFADRNRLVQVIVNLLSNAMKYSPQNGQIILESQSKDGWLECRVIDHGPGIAESFRKQIFEPFKQVDATDATTKKGTGLGLTISRSIVEQHGGQIAVDSEEGKGSTFWFKVPDNTAGKQAAASSTNRLLNSNTIKPSVLSSNASRIDKSNSPQAGKYGVLKQGLVIIALPLLFQIGFAVVFNNMIDGICKQVDEEHNSMKVLQVLNNGSNDFIKLLGKAEAYVYLPMPSLSKASEDLKTTLLRYLNEAYQLIKANPEQVKDLNKAKQLIEAMSALFEQEALTRESKIAFDKMDFAFREKIYTANKLHLKPANAEEAAEAKEGMAPIRMLESFKIFCNDPFHKKILPLYKLQNHLDSAMDRERKFSQQAAEQRSKMISTMEQTLFCGVLATVVISILIALFLMRSITSRLQHLMQNTHRLVKKEVLDPPIRGNDEIAYLDHVLFETGNRLGELETFKRELVSIVSHELRTPLLSISSALELFGTGMYGNFSDKGKSRLYFAQGEATRLIRLINDLLDIEKMEAGKFILDISEVKVAEIIEASTAAAAQLAEAKQIKLETVLCDQDTSIFVDRDRICQVLINLLSNAIKYSPENGTISVSAQQLDNGNMKWSVSDQGRGIPDELRKQVFDRFVQVEKSDATERGGTGLGLAICKAIVEQHSGTIGVDSTVGAGSTFWFIIPTINSKVQTPMAVANAIGGRN